MIITRAAVLAPLVFGLPQVPAASQSARAIARAESRTDGSPLLSRPARLNLERTPLAAALVALGESSGVAVSFSPTQLRDAPEATCPCEAATVGQALTTLLAGTPLTFQEVAGVIVVKLSQPSLRSSPLLSPPAYAPRAVLASTARSSAGDDGSSGRSGPRWGGLRMAVLQDSIVGTVQDGRSRPIAGATVAILGTATSAATDSRGRFRLTNLGGTEITLRVSAIGFTPRTETVKVGTGDLTVVLTEMPVKLDELVVTGTAGETQRRALGNSISRVSAADVNELAVANDVGKLLNARAPGVSVVPSSGKVGAGPQVTIRGRSTLSLSSQPLLYVDGARVVNDFATGPPSQGGTVVSRMNDISPEDIESIEIIKGPAAATLYGTEAANGVIQIITKKGASGKPVLDAKIDQGTNWFMDPEGRMPTNFARDANGALLSWNPIEQENALGNPIFQNGHIQSAAVSLSGGNPTTQYYAGTNFDRNTGVDPLQLYRRFAAHANLTTKPTETFDVNLSMNVLTSHNELGQDDGSSTMFSSMFGSPLTVNTPKRGFFFAPPEAHYSGDFQTTQDVDRFTGSIKLNHRAASWFTHRLTVGLDQTQEANILLTKRLGPSVAQFFPGSADGSISDGRRTIRYETADYSLTVTKGLQRDLKADWSVGGQYYRRRVELSQVNGRGFPTTGVTTAAAAATTTGSTDELTNTTVGLFAQQQLAWKNRLFVTAGLRFDNNSAFGDNFDLATYPKLGAAWVVREESPRPGAILNTLRLRAAYGASGQQPETFAALRSYAPTAGPGGTPAVRPEFVGNSDLKPERGVEFEGGLEARLFDRVTLDLTYFRRTTKDAILLRPVAPSSGFAGAQFVNIGETRNHGIEMQLDVQALDRRNVRLDFSGNLATSADKITDMGTLDRSPVNTFTPQTNRVGYPIGAFFARRVASAQLDANGQPINVLCDGGPGAAPMPCASAPSVFLGTITPKVLGAGSLTLRLFDKIQVYGLVDFKAGHRSVNGDRLIRCALFRVCEVLAHPDQYDPTLVAEATLGGLGQNGIVSQFVESASFAKLREISVTYTLPRAIVRPFGAREARLTLAGRNLHTWTGWSGLDPESRASYGSLFRTSLGVDERLSYSQADLPQLAEFVASLRIRF
jgi:TonB-linked SusC/RagA family outer membrane protein